MKTGILMAMADDRRTGEPLTGVLPYDQAVKEFKRRVEAQEAPAGFPNLEIWTGKVKSRRIKATTIATAEKPPSPASGESTDDSSSNLDPSPEANEATEPAPEAPDAEAGNDDDTGAADDDDADDDDAEPALDLPSEPASPGAMSPAAKRGKRKRSSKGGGGD